jgi:uncharacterized membrane protein YqaE (UPF0057 family)
MRKLKLFLAAAVLSVGLFSCSSNSEFARVKYLDKTYAKKHKINLPEKLDSEELAKAASSSETNEKEELQVLEAMQPTSNEVVTADKEVVKPSVTIANKKFKKAIEEIAATESLDNTMNMEEVFAAVTAVKKSKKSKGILGFLGLSEVMLILLVILAFLLPPLAVYLKQGIGTHFWISLILTLLYLFAIGGFPYLIPIAIIHALLVVFEVI